MEIEVKQEKKLPPKKKYVPFFLKERERGIFIKQKYFQYSVTASLFSTKLKLLHSYDNTKDDYSSYLKLRIVP